MHQYACRMSAMSCECESEGTGCIFMTSVCAVHTGIFVCISTRGCAVSHAYGTTLNSTYVFRIVCLWSIQWVRGVIEALLTWLCGGSCPGSGTVMDSMRCQSLGSLLASGTEVAVLNIALPCMSPNTTAHFKVNCLCGAARSPP